MVHTIIYGKRFLIFSLALALLLASLLASCQSSATQAQIQVTDAWGRPSPMQAQNGAFYMILKNTSSQADRLVAAQSNACGSVELHESYMTGDGAMGMRPVEGGIEIPAGGQVELKVGGLHMMCINKQADFSPGTRLLLTLQFEQSSDQTIEVEILQP